MPKQIVYEHRIGIYLPYLFSIRDFLFTPIWNEIIQNDHTLFVFFCSNKKVFNYINETRAGNVDVVHLASLQKTKKRNAFIIHFAIKIFRRINIKYLHDALNYRFAAINKLSHQNIRKNKSRRGKSRDRVFLDYRGGEWVGKPFPRSRVIYKFLYYCRFYLVNPIFYYEREFFRKIKLDLFVFARIHTPTNAYLLKIMDKNFIPVIGIVASWDHPTTKGPTPPGVNEFIVQSNRMVEEMQQLHGIPRKDIYQIGKPQMDIFSKKEYLKSRKDFFSGMGVPLDNKLIVFGTNTTGLKEHEVSIARHVARNCIEGKYGSATIFIRTHPQDKNWKRDFLALSKKPYVLCSNSSTFGLCEEEIINKSQEDQILLANLMHHADVVIQSRGSLALDAIAFDTPVISIAFDGALKRSKCDSFIREYEFEHYKPLVRDEGCWMVGSFSALDKAICSYLKNPSIHSKGRQKIRKDHIEPLDGKTGTRLMERIISFTEKDNKKKKSTYCSLGDVNWYKQQSINIEAYIDF